MRGWRETLFTFSDCYLADFFCHFQPFRWESGAFNTTDGMSVSIASETTIEKIVTLYPVKRRFVCLRQEISERPQASGRRLIDCPGYSYRVMVNSVPYAAEM